MKQVVEENGEFLLSDKAGNDDIVLKSALAAIEAVNTPSLSCSLQLQIVQAIH